MTKSQAGFTLLELVIAIAIFALLGIGCWRLFDSVVRAEIEKGGSLTAPKAKQIEGAEPAEPVPAAKH